MKKLLISLALTGTLASSVLAQQSATPIYREMPLLNGWNLWLTNALTYVPGEPTNLFTTFQGQVAFSLTNQTINGVVNTNSIAPDAFNVDGVLLPTDVNGDKVANAAVHVVINNTNWIPQVTTNSFGQYFTTNWLLAASTTPNWMYPATTNYYPALGAHSTNTIQFFLQGGWSYSLGNNKNITVWDTTTNTFQFTMNTIVLAPSLGGTNCMVTMTTNLPTSFTQTYNKVRLAAVVVGANASGLGDNAILNQISIGAPVP